MNDSAFSWVIPQRRGALPSRMTFADYLAGLQQKNFAPLAALREEKYKPNLYIIKRYFKPIAKDLHKFFTPCG